MPRRRNAPSLNYIYDEYCSTCCRYSFTLLDIRRRQVDRTCQVCVDALKMHSLTNCEVSCVLNSLVFTVMTTPILRDAPQSRSQASHGRISTAGCAQPAACNTQQKNMQDTAN
jgi:Fe-S-cluster-containing dehydrogenase component